MNKCREWVLQQLRLGKVQELLTMMTTLAIVYFFSTLCVLVVRYSISNGFGMLTTVSYAVSIISIGSIFFYYLPIHSAKLNLTLATQIDSAIRFDSARDLIKMTKNSDMLEFAKRKKLQVYTSNESLQYGVSENVKGKIDTLFLTPFDNSSKMYELIGQQRLLLNNTDFSIISAAYIESINGNLAAGIDQSLNESQARINDLVKENTNLIATIKETETSLHTADMRNKKAVLDKKVERLRSVLTAFAAFQLGKSYVYGNEYTHDDIEKVLAQALLDDAERKDDAKYKELKRKQGTAPDDLVDRVWEGLPSEMRNQGGRRKGSKAGDS